LEKVLADNARAKQASPDIEDIRQKMAQQLEASLADGSLENVLEENARHKQASPDVEDIRLRMARQLETSLTDGSLEAALAENANSKRITPGDDRQIKHSSQLESKATMPAGQTIEEVLARISDLEAKLDVAPKVVPQPAIPSPTAKEPKAVEAYRPMNTQPSSKAMQGAVALLQVISSYDRRVGKLSKNIEEMERRITERTQQASQIQVQIQDARHEASRTQNALLDTTRGLDQEELREIHLQESSRKLSYELSSEKLKYKHAAVEFDSFSWRSRSPGLTSTVCSLRDLSSTPFTPPPKGLY